MDKNKIEQKKAELLESLDELEHDVKILINMIPEIREKMQSLTADNYQEYNSWFCENVYEKLNVIDF